MEIIVARKCVLETFPWLFALIKPTPETLNPDNPKPKGSRALSQSSSLVLHECVGSIDVETGTEGKKDEEAEQGNDVGAESSLPGLMRIQVWSLGL